MYGTGIGTGVGGSTVLLTGAAVGSNILMGAAALALAMMATVLWRNARRRESHQRP